MGPIRRCLECNNKTHKMFWKREVECPVCERAVGWSESLHGGLRAYEIESLKSELRKIEGQGKPPDK